MTPGRLAPVLMLLATGAAWGLTIPLMTVAMSTGHGPLGVVVWQKVVTATVLLALLAPMRLSLPPLRGRIQLYAVVAIFGAILPGYFSFLTAAHLPAGVRAIVIAIVPMFALPLAIAAGMERPDARRAVGVLLGAAAIALIAQPGAGVTTEAGLGMLLLAQISPVSYAVEATYLAWRGSGGLHPFQLLLGAACLGLVLSWPLALALGQTVSLAAWGPPEWAILGAGVLNAFAYAGYVWLVGRAGSVFASQIAYVVTGFGVVWSKILLGETYSAWVWLAFGLLCGGLALVRPRKPGVESA